MKKGNVTLISWNVNGIRAIKQKGFEQWMSNSAADVICLQETKISEDKLVDDIREVPGFYSYWSCAERKGYSGTVTFCREAPISVKYGFGIKKFDNEGRIVLTEHKNFFLFNIYFPNSGQGEERLKYKLEFPYLLSPLYLL